MKLFLIMLFFLAASFESSAAGPIFNMALDNNANSNSWKRNGAVLDLDFAKNRYYFNNNYYSNFTSFVSAIGGTFSRSSTATYYDANGILQMAASNVARFDHDPITKEPKGLLIEESSTNEILNSAGVGGSSWNRSNAISIVSSNELAPDGTNTANLLNASGAEISLIAQTNLAESAGKTATLSVYAKAGTADKLIFEIYDTTYCGNFCLVEFNLTTGVGSWHNSNVGQGKVSMIKLSNGWYRCIFTYTHSASTGPGRYVMFINAWGAGVGTLSLWGAQYEFKSFVSSYIPTSSSIASRLDDQFSFPSSGWFNSNEGTFLASTYGELNSTNGQESRGRVIGGDAPKGFITFRGEGRAAIGSWNNVTENYIEGGSTIHPSPNALSKMAMAWSSSTNTLSLGLSKGVLLSNASYAGDWTTSNIYPGGSSFNRINASLDRMTYFNQRMSDNYLKNMCQ